MTSNQKNKLNAYVPDDLHTWLKIHAATEKKSASVIMENLITQLKSDFKIITKTLDAIIDGDTEFSNQKSSNKGWSVSNDCFQVVDDVTNKTGLSKNYIISLLIFNYKLEVEAANEQ